MSPCPKDVLNRRPKIKDWFFVVLPWRVDKYIEKSITREWCKKNCDGDWARDRIFKVDEAVYFESESDKVKFILKFM